ncbi:flippase-like domain-containing protein [Bacteroidales bacterium OttesenSCG-928-I21]|nr:flippase-like domain-containing protein [Bacteroidales bacterium OttesenSCG-928-I21]
MIKKIIIAVVKTLIIIGAYYFVVKKIYTSPDIQNFKYYFIDLKNYHYFLLLIIFFLMFLNWSFESLKWKFLIKSLENISFFNSFKAIWVGITVGTVTPNRIGEFGGRILFLKKQNRTKAVSLTLYGDLSQFIVTIVLGIAGFYFITSNVLFANSEIKQFEQLIVLFSALAIILALFFYFNINFCFQKLNKIKKIKKLAQKFTPDQISFEIKIKSILLSMFRYAIFSSQFYFAMQFFGIEISFLNSLIATSSIYLSLNIIPNIPFAEIGLRASFAVIFLGLFTDKITAIVLASLLIYAINIALPTIIGGIFLIKHRNTPYQHL